MSDHVLKVEMGEFTNYHLTCNLDDAADCHQVCATHQDGCDPMDAEGECVREVYRNGCTIAEWVNDGGIESVGFEHTVEIPVTYQWVGFEHTVEIPVTYQWNASHDAPSIHAASVPVLETPAPDVEYDAKKLLMELLHVRGAAESARILIWDQYNLHGGDELSEAHNLLARALQGDHSMKSILDAVEPVPAPRLEWLVSGVLGYEEFFNPVSRWCSGKWLIDDESEFVEGAMATDYWFSLSLMGDAEDFLLGKFRTLDAAKSLAEKLNAVLSPPVGPT